MSKFNKPYVAIGGTFSTLHIGHQYILTECINLSKVLKTEILVGITTCPLTINKHYKVPSENVRVKNVKDYMVRNGIDEEHMNFIYIESKYGPLLTNRYRVKILVSSLETIKNSREINVLRRVRGLKPIPLYIVSLFLSEYSYKVSSEYIFHEVSDDWGRVK